MVDYNPIATPIKSLKKKNLITKVTWGYFHFLDQSGGQSTINEN